MAYDLYSPHRIDTSPAATFADMDAKPLAGFLLGKLGAQVMADGLVGGPHDRVPVFYPNLYVLGTRTMHFTHLVMPVSAGKSRGVFRFCSI